MTSSLQTFTTMLKLDHLKGLDGVKLKQVSTEFGATKGAIFHHFKDQAELIERCYVPAFDIYDLIMRTSMASDIDPLSRATFVAHLNSQAQLSPCAPLALQPGFSKLSPARRVEFTQRAQVLSIASSSNLEAAIQQGLCRPLETVTASQIAAGYFLGFRRWARAGQPPRETADFIVDILMYGLQRPLVCSSDLPRQSHRGERIDPQ